MPFQQMIVVACPTAFLKTQFNSETYQTLLPGYFLNQWIKIQMTPRMKKSDAHSKIT